MEGSTAPARTHNRSPTTEEQETQRGEEWQRSRLRRLSANKERAKESAKKHKAQRKEERERQRQHELQRHSQEGMTMEVEMKPLVSTSRGPPTQQSTAAQPTSPPMRGGCLTQATEMWDSICAEMRDNLVATWVRTGVNIPPCQRLPQFAPTVKELPFKQEEREWLRKNIEEWIGQGVVERVGPYEPHKRIPSFRQWVSRVFLVPKKQPSKQPYRVVIDMRELNRYFEGLLKKFRMEDQRVLRMLLEEGDHMVTMDLESGFWHIPLSPDMARLMAFPFEGTLFRFLVLPFGFCLSPTIFTRVIRVPIKWLRLHHAMSICAYLDDFCFHHQEAAVLETQVAIARTLFSRLNVHVNADKSHLTPSQKQEFLGYTVDTRAWRYVVPEKKRVKLLAEVRQLRYLCSRGISVSVTRVTSLVGKLRAVKLAAPWLRMVAGPLQNWSNDLRCDDDPHLTHTIAKLQPVGRYQHVLNTAVNILTNDYTAPIRMRYKDMVTAARLPLLAVPGTNKTEEGGTPLLVEIKTDASSTGFGASIANGPCVSGVWEEHEAYLHINVLEIRAVKKTLAKWAHLLRGCTIRLVTDNQTAATYIWKVSGRSHECSEEALSLWRLARDLDITILKPRWISTNSNAVADSLSRSVQLHDWRLTTECFHTLNQRWGPITVDRFATRESRHTERYNSLAEQRDALAATDWGAPHQTNLAVPPFALLSHAVRVTKDQRARTILVTPYWPTAPFWPLLASLMTDWCPLSQWNDFLPETSSGFCEPWNLLHTPMRAVLIDAALSRD